MSKRKKLVKWMGYILYLLLATILILEITYRNYWFDFYGPELRALNQDSELEPNSKPSILVIGDSFTAHPDSYVSILRDSIAAFNFINAGIPGTSAHQNLLPLKKRLHQLNPKAIIYQIYVGNDLLEFRHPTDSKNIGLVRRLYWWLSDYVRILGLLNYRSLSIRHYLYDDLPAFKSEHKNASFDPQLYTPRTRMHIKAEPHQVEEVVMREGKRSEDITRYTQRITQFLSLRPSEIPVVLLMVPHSIQVNTKYQKRHQILGGQIDDSKKLLQRNYPLFNHLRNELEDETVMIANPLLSLREADDVLAGVYHNNDPHLTADGQKVLGNYLTEFLQVKVLKNVEYQH